MSKLCVVCGSHLRFGFKKHRFTILHCPHCGLYRTILPGSYRQFLKDYYAKGYFTGSRTRAGYADYPDDAPVIRRNAQNYLKLILKHHLSGRRLLDVGCATGIFMQQAQDQGFKVSGLDASVYAVAQAKKTFPRQVKLGTLSTVKFPPRSFDLITLFDVFEHLHDPEEDLARCHQLLRPGGLLVINTGNTNSFLAKLEGQKWHFFIPPQHLYLYSDINLKQLLKLHGFKVLSIYTTGKHISLRYLWHLMRTINHSRLADLCYRLFHHTFMGKLSLYLNLYDNMTIIAEKI
jgi:2-polyprenyl-3-methyl-5-hydroxy-6-metoxy-1,4-benzoquinol methylase